MIDGLPGYAEYRPSGVEWLGDVPAHWEVGPITRLGQLFKGNGGSKEDEVSQGVPCVRYGDLYTQHEFFIRSTRACISTDRASAYTTICIGDLLFAASGETIEDIGRSAVNLLDDGACCGGDVLLLRPSVPVDSRFLGYAADAAPARHQKASMGRGYTVVHIYASQLKWLMLPLPPLPEQSAIVRFLEHADARIRRAVQSKRRLIALLTEEKQAIIHRAVTRGLEPDVPLRPSGVEWLGDVPAHWELIPAKYFYREVDERSTTGSEELLSVSHITGVTPRSQKNITMFMASSYVGHKLCRPGDLVINTMWAWMGALGIANQIGIVSPSYGVYRPILESDFENEYIRFLLGIQPYRNEFVCRSTGIRLSRLRLYPEQFLRIKLLLPPIDEQMAILKFIRMETAESDHTIAATQREIDLLLEFRTRLIADVVTGKLDVRGVAAGLPATTPGQASLDAFDAPAGEETDIPMEIDTDFEEEVEA